MTKWIDQESKKRTSKYDPLDAAIKSIWFEAGATAMRDKVMELIEKTKEGDLGYILREWDMSRESLRQELMKSLTDL